MVRLTEAGTDFFAGIAAQHRNWIAEMMGGLTAEEMKTLYALLARLKDSIHAVERDDRLEAAE